MRLHAIRDRDQHLIGSCIARILGQLRVSAGDAIWSSAQTFPVRVFTDRDHDFTDSPLDAGYIDCG